MKNRRGVELPISTLILLIIAILVLAITIFFFRGMMGKIAGIIIEKIKLAFSWGNMSKAG